MGSRAEEEGEEGQAAEGQPLVEPMAEPHVGVKAPEESEEEPEAGHDTGLETGDEGAAGGPLPVRVSALSGKMPMPRHHHSKRKKGGHGG